MVTLDMLRGQQREAILGLGSQHGARTMRVFGSVARGDNDESSDIDFLVEFDSVAGGVKGAAGAEVEIVTPSTLRYLRDRVLDEARAL
jgi:uncharacterized protein